MAVCSYLVFPDEGAHTSVRNRLSAIPGCQVFPAENRDLLLLVTETEGTEEEESLRETIESTPGVRALVLTFGELDPSDPPDRPHGRGRASLPVLDPEKVDEAVRSVTRRGTR